MNEKPDQKLRRPRVPGPAQYVLPELPYAYDALEPHIDAETMQLHHDVHHRGYTNAANRSLAALHDANEAGDYTAVKSLSRDLAFNLSGHVLHSIFWPNMAPAGEGAEPSAALSDQFRLDFGGLERFKAHFGAAAMSVEGSGWAVLAWAPRGQRLLVLQVEKHQNLTVQDVTPLLVLDVWEHAYYLKYRHRRDEYVRNWWHVVNWNDVSQRYGVARGHDSMEPRSEVLPEVTGAAAKRATDDES